MVELDAVLRPHTGAYENIPAPDLFIAKASALTHRIGLGTGTINLPYHDPFMVAERLTFLDHLTHGRLIYGFGGGGLVSDRSFFQLDKDEGTARMHEALDIIEQLFANTEYIDYSGKFWDLDHKRIQVRPYQEHPQFSVAGMSGTHNFALCGERGYSALSIDFTPTTIENNPGMPDLVAQGRALANAASTAGRDPAKARDDWRICCEVYVSDSKNAAMNEIRESLKQSYDYLFKIGLAPLMKRDVMMPDADVSFDWMVENIPWIIGSPPDCTAQIRELDEAVGGFGSLLFNSREWVTTDRWNRSLELFARYVSPHFRRRDDQRFRSELAADALGG
jgi:limonene 1,2-monooxygenase